MPVNKLPESSPVRLKLVTAALRLVTISVFLTREVGCSAASQQHRWLGLVRVSG